MSRSAENQSTPTDDDSEEFSLFDQEKAVIRQTEDMLRKLEQVADGVKALAAAYQKGYREQRRLVRLSDRMQYDLQSAKQRLSEQAVDLASLNAQLHAEIQHRQQLVEDMHRLAVTDPLTGVFTRRYLFEVGAREILECTRHGGHLSLLLVDLDHFKDVNDNHGHAAGDEALRVFSRRTLEELRAVDVLARMGGEEFAILLPNTPLTAALEVAERLRAVIADGKVPWEGETIMFTTSIGVAEYQESDERLETLLARADKALYAAKDNGRNRVEQAPVSD